MTKRKLNCQIFKMKDALLVVLCLCGLVCTGQTDDEFEDLLRSRDIYEHTIIILKHHGITKTNTLRALEKDDIKELGISLGQRAKLWEVVQELKVSDGLDHMSKGRFWCLFKCLGGWGAVGLTGILALVGLIYALPAAGFTAAGIAAGSLAAKIMSLYGGHVAAGSLFATLQSLGAVGLSWKAILTALFGSGKVMEAITGSCAYCFKED